MNENSSTDKDSNVANIDPIDILTPDVTSNIKTIIDLWSLARMTKDMEERHVRQKADALGVMATDM